MSDGVSTAFEPERPRVTARHEFALLIALFLVLQGVSVLLLARTAVRPITYYAVAAAMVAVIVIQVLRLDLTRSRVSAILLEIAALMANLIWSVTLNYHYYFGRTDVFGHESSIQSLLDVHHVTGAFGEYEAFPLWHVLIASEAMLFDGGADTLFLAFLTSGIAFMVLIATVYLLARRFGFTKDVSLLAALLMCLQPFVIFSGMYAIPRSIASVLFVVSLLALVRTGWRYAVLFLGFAVAIAVYHTVTIPFIIATLSVYYVIERYLPSMTNDQEYVVRPAHLFALAGIQLGYWLIAAPNILARVVTVLQESLIAGIGGGGQTETEAASEFISMPFHELANYVPFSFLLLFILYGVIRGPAVSRISFRGKVVLLTSLALSAVSFPGPLLLVGEQLNILRFSLYTAPFIAIGAAVGVVAALRTEFRYGTSDLKVGLVVVLLLTSGFVAVSNDFVASDNPLVEREFYTHYFTEAEVESFDAVGEAAGDDVMSDYVTCRYYSSSPTGECNIIQADPETGDVHFEGQDLLLVREGELADRPLQFYATDEYVEDPAYYESLEYADQDSPVWDGRSSSDRVYDSEGVSVYADD
ncbi:hypothetical protein [Haloterrigena alkaliphila]|uniref:Glycosyltransferase RgtA/B/C/D-like domain-containing protein n=1 Tax=Haloterrigena alkaliphila TaxID=2816475 RepID=A0A8A2VDC6_9EURY|nr:hypothetical protein [Haloterrigena alkaliphila]QSX00040.1 hypothetical protein J0X25_03480 [Haloterrigena alkaliphila]